MASIDGLGSGLDTTTLVSQLMGLEQAPKQRLVTQRLGVLSQGTAWGKIEAAFNSLKAATTKLGEAGALAPTKATSSNAALVAVTSTAGAQAASYQLNVARLAVTEQLASSPLASRTALVGVGSVAVAAGMAGIGAGAVTATGAAAGSYALEVRGTGADAVILVDGVETPHTVSQVDGVDTVEVAGLRFATSGLTEGSASVTVVRTTDTTTLDGLGAMLNAARGPVTATVVDDGMNTAGGSTTLRLAGTQTGAAHRVLVGTDLASLGGVTSTRAAADAELTLDGQAIRRPTNTISDLVPGLTLSLQSADPAGTATLQVTPDTPTAAATVKGMVDAVNGVLREVKTNTTYDVANKKGQPLTGNAAARGLASSLMTAISTAGIGAGATLSEVGISLQRDGTYAFDEKKLTAALAADPDAVADRVTRLTEGVGAVVAAAVATDGVVATGKAGATTRALGLQKEVDRWDARLALVEARLLRQYNALDVALGSLKNQGAWVTSQLASLSSFSNS